jgi:hypothetical protein
MDGKNSDLSSSNNFNDPIEAIIIFLPNKKVLVGNVLIKSFLLAHGYVNLLLS